MSQTNMRLPEVTKEQIEYIRMRTGLPSGTQAVIWAICKIATALETGIHAAVTDTPLPSGATGQISVDQLLAAEQRFTRLPITPLNSQPPAIEPVRAIDAREAWLDQPDRWNHAEPEEDFKELSYEPCDD